MQTLILSYLLSGWKPCSIIKNGVKLEGMAIRKGNNLYFRDMNGVRIDLVNG